MERIADILRTRVAPILIPKSSGSNGREFLFRTVSQIMLNYRGGPLSQGSAGHVHGGDLLPWVARDGRDNFDTLAIVEWQIHVYGTVNAELSRWCSSHGVAPCLRMARAA